VQRCGRVHPSSFSIHRRHIDHLSWLAAVKYFYSCHKPNIYCDLRLSSTLIKRTLTNKRGLWWQQQRHNCCRPPGCPPSALHGTVRCSAVGTPAAVASTASWDYVATFKSSRTTASRHPPSYSGNCGIELVPETDCSSEGSLWFSSAPKK